MPPGSLLPMAMTIALIAMMSLAPGASGQSTNDPASPPESALSDRLEQLNAELEAQREALAAQRAEQAQQRADRRARRAQLAGEAVDLERRRQALQHALDELKPRVDRAAKRRAAASEAWRRVKRSAGVLADQVALYASELPGRAKAAERARQADLALSNGEVETGYAQLAGFINELDAGAQSVTLAPVELRTADGRREPVDLLSVGHVAFAYRVDDRIGLAFASPEDASGHRWREDLPEALAARWRGVFDEASGASGSADAGAMIDVPLDPTGRIRAEAAIARTGLADRFETGGPVMWPLAIVAALCAALLLERGWALYVRNGIDVSLAPRVVESVRAGDAEGAAALARRRNNSVSRTLAALLARRQAGQHAMEDSVQEQLLYEMPRLQRFLRGIGILAAVAPLLGLLGTVTGIIETFNVIRTVGNTAPSMMAGGISEALLTTATGLSIAIPVLLVNGVMRGRVDRIIAEAEEQAATLLNALTHDRPGGDAEKEGGGDA